MRLAARRSLIALAAGLGLAAAALADGIPCVGDAGDPADPARGRSDLSIAHMAEQPAGAVVCSMGYLAAKCGDFTSAHRIFDKCIAKGFGGAMIWKALLDENGQDVPRDLAHAAALFRQAADATDATGSHYAAPGKLHDASALHEGPGVARDREQARRGFEAAAAQGSADAQESLRSGSHPGARQAARTRGCVAGWRRTLSWPAPVPFDSRQCESAPARPEGQPARGRLHGLRTAPDAVRIKKQNRTIMRTACIPTPIWTRALRPPAALPLLPTRTAGPTPGALSARRWCCPARARPRPT